MELTEKLLVSLGGWPVMKQARAIHSLGHVTEATYEIPLLKGKIASDGKSILAGLRLRNPVDIENLCGCRDSRHRGLICAHSIAIALEVMTPHKARSASPTSTRTHSPLTPPPQRSMEIPVVDIHIEGSLRHLEAKIDFQYSMPGIQNSEAEAETLMELSRLGFEDSEGKAVLRGEDAVIRFYATALPSLKSKWKITEGERFKHVTGDLVRIEPHFAIREKSEGWLDFHVHFTAGKDAVLSVQDLQRLLRSGNPRLRLADGRMAVPDSQLADDLEEVLRDCNPEQDRGVFRIRKSQHSYIESCIASWQGTTEPRPTSRFGLENLGPLREKLRPYQIEGALWLLECAHASLGGLLADDMGLGKTIQSLAMMESLPGPHLVVCPSSLVWNWKREAGFFVPDLQVLALDGPDREDRFQDIPNSSIVITSYALLRRDIEKYKAHQFSTVFLDEAQHIKNPDSQNAKAASGIKSGVRFILTGTPLENSIRDLWSLFDFLIPGYLGSRKDFQDRYEKPLAEGNRGSVWPRLLRRVKPRMLRRNKKDILNELPDKIEQLVEVELTPDQKAIYTQLQIAARAEVDALKDSGGAARMRVLTALLRLRQASCDLRLLGGKSPNPSAKLEALLELVREASDGGHRTLVFSQFTGMLDLIAPALNDVGINWCRLDGSTRDRSAVVERFQSDSSIAVFLISLKAGGTGLNLTAADTVIHFDPWWNPAVEAQATDRAHRIGQKNVVTSIKLIARDTVEQRVLEMQAKKQSLITDLLNPEQPTLPLNESDLLELIG